MDKKQEEMYAILKKELAPALGCTGPTAVSYVAAEAATAVGGKPLKVEVKVDRHIGTKNSDVGIPGTSSVGLKIAAALGAIAGDAQAGLNVLHKVTKEDEAVAQAFSKSGNVSVIPDLETDILGLYMDCVVTTDKGIGRAIVLKTHTNLVVNGAIGAGAEMYYGNLSGLVKYYLPINDHFEQWYMYINTDKWNSLSDNQRNALQTAADNMQKARWDVAEGETDEYEHKLRNSGTIVVDYTDEQLGEFAKVVREAVWPAIAE